MLIQPLLRSLAGEQILRTLSFMYDAADADCDVYAATAKMLLMARISPYLPISPHISPYLPKDAADGARPQAALPLRPVNSASSQPAGREQALALKLLYLSVFVLRCRAGDPPAPRQHGGVSRPRLIN